jgi:hypothetical protein
MIKSILKSVCIISIFTGVGALFTLHAFTYWSIAIFYLSFSISLLLFPIYLLFNRNKFEKFDKKTRKGNYIWGIISSLIIGLGSFFIGKPYILDIPYAISKKYVTLKNAEIIKADFHQGTGRAATLNTYYDVLVKEADGKQITLEVYTNFNNIRGKRTLTNYNISYLSHSKEIVSVSLSKSSISVQKQNYLSQLYMVVTDYNKVLNEYNQYQNQYSTKEITVSQFRDHIGALLASLVSDNTQVRYVQDIAPASALNMIQKLNDSINDFSTYIDLVDYSLKTSNQTETSQAQSYLIKSDQAFYEFHDLYEAYISNK